MAGWKKWAGCLLRKNKMCVCIREPGEEKAGCPRPSGKKKERKEETDCRLKKLKVGCLRPTGVCPTAHS